MHKNCNNTYNRCELKDKVLDVAMPVFKQRGIKSVKMDEIASMLSMSKRTLYEFYENKEQLLLEGMKRSNEKQTAHLAAFALTASNEMDILIEFLRMKMEDLYGINPVFFSDLHKYTHIVEYLHSQHVNQRKNSLEFMQKGVEHGYFVPNINYDMVLNFIDAVMDNVMNTRMYEKYPMQEIFHTMISLFMRGNCTEKGIKVLDKFL